ncbi:hypothetical protein JKF63_07297 [Porcisia hertigi]|uniref:Uncharacterized protein n=1 Tax=Porcisia hertigi TaxID=2761500 RepID=A0A836LLH9_9TRYP|nr:hypothetical protein JKF63_07297 [Porcisia hertigi]
MSAFTTPSRMSSTAAAGAADIRHSGSGGGSSSRRVVRSALEILMDTASPELAEKNSVEGGGSMKRKTTAPTSSFSVTYTTAPAAMPASSEAHAAVRSAVADASSAAEFSGATSAIMAHSCAEPSALDFLSPHGKDARGISVRLRQSTESRHPHRSRGPSHAPAPGAMLRLSGEHSRQSQRGRKGVGHDKRDFDDSKVDADFDEEVCAEPPPSTAVTLSPVSPSRSLSADVEAAQHALPSVAERPHGRSPSPTPASLAPQSAVRSIRQASSAAEKAWGLEGVEAEEDEAAALVIHADMEAAVGAALRRYRKERDAEEEAVLQQVSREVEEQARRHAELVEAYNVVCSDRAALQEKLTEATEVCEELRRTLQKARQTEEVQRKSLRQLEVELCHARDAQHQQGQQCTVLKADAVEWEAQRARYEKRQKTLEAELDRAREELRAKEACVAQQSHELSSLRERSAKTSVEADEDYADIHYRMRQLAQNMSSMESALRERDATIAEQAARLREASERSESEVRALTAEKEKAEAALTSARDALQRQTDEIRRRMHRLVHLEQQRDVLKDRAKAARDAIQTASMNHGRVVQSIQDLLSVTKQRLSYTVDRRGRLGPQSSTLSPRGPHRFPADACDDNMNDTLVYEDDDVDEPDDPPNHFDVSQSSSRCSSVNHTLEISSLEDDSDAGSGRPYPCTAAGATTKHRSVSSPTPRSHRTPLPSPVRVAERRRARTSSPYPSARVAAQRAPTKAFKGNASLSHAWQELRRQDSQAVLLLRELRRWVLSLTSRNQKSLHSGRVNAEGIGRNLGLSGVTAARLEQACRYLKSELEQAQAALKEAQAECQWRTLSMNKWEGDLQAARRDALVAEKRRLECEAQAETAVLVREELEVQLAELKASCAAATAVQKAAEDALVEAKYAAERGAARAEEAAQLREAAESSLAREQTMCARQAANQTALADEMEALKEKHNSVLAQLQTHQAREAAQLLKEQQQEEEGRGREVELVELRSVVETMKAAHENAAEMWKTERASLEAVVSSLETKLRALTEMSVNAKRRCATLEEQLGLHAHLERTSLQTIGEVVHHALPLPDDFLDAADGGGVSPTEKQLFRGDEEAPEMEEVVVVPAEAKSSGNGVCKKVANTSTHTRTLTRRATALSLVSARLSTPSSTSPNLTSSTAVSSVWPASALSRGGAALEAEGLTSAAALAYLRQQIASAVQKLALEVARLRQATVIQPAKVPIITQPQTMTSQSRSAATSGVWYGGEDALNSVCTHAPAEFSPPARVSGGGRTQSCMVALLPSPPSGAVNAPQSHPQRQQRYEPQRSSHNPCPFTGSALRTRTSAEAAQLSPFSVHCQGGSPPTSSQQAQRVTAGGSPGSCSLPVPAVASTAVGEHMYNVSQWCGFCPQRSPSSSASPPASHPAVSVYGKLSGEAQRSVSTRDGLSGSSFSAARGSVDGSCSPPRLPSLRALSLPR